MISSIQEFEDYYDAEYATKEMNDKKVEGYRLIVEPSGQKKGRPRSYSRERSHNKRRKRERYKNKY